MCESGKLDLHCHRLQINILEANYGRLSGDVCSAGRAASQIENVNCRSTQALDVLKARCEGKERCNVNVDKNTLNSGADPCQDIYKYLTVDYKCVGEVYYFYFKGVSAMC